MGLLSFVFGRKAATAPEPAAPAKPVKKAPSVDPDLADRIANSTVEEVKVLVRRKKVTAEDALKAEKAGRKRKSLIAALERAGR